MKKVRKYWPKFRLTGLELTEKKQSEIPQEALTHLKTDICQWCGTIAWMSD